MDALPTPPYSEFGSAGPCPVLTVSESFSPFVGLPDLCLVSLDAVLFYVNSALLLSASGNFFNGLPAVLAAQDDSHAQGAELGVGGQALQTVFMMEDGAVLNLVLHAIYGRSLADLSPSAADLAAAADVLVNRYAVHLPPLGPGCILYDAAVVLARCQPLDAYMLAAGFDAEQLAVTCSAHLVSLPLASLTEAQARRMGAPFFCRLMCLHLSRVAALGRLLAAPPTPHAYSDVCSQERMDDLEHCWRIAGAAILCDARAGVPNSYLEAVLRPLLARLGCRACHQALSTRIADLISQWSSVKDTI